MKSLLLVCDFEEFSLPWDFGKKISEKLMLEKSYEGIQRVLNLIKIHHIKMTFFVTEKIAKVYSDLLKQLIASGHEVGLHACIDYTKNSDINKILSRIKSIKEKIEDNIRTKIYGFKNHKLIILPSYIVRGAGFAYDNTCHPTYVPGRYFYFLKSRKIQFNEGIVNIPISVTPIFRLPFSWIWIRNLGVWYTKFCTSWNFLTQDYANIYVHPWDFADLNGKLGFKLPYIITRNTGQIMIKILDTYLKWCDLYQIRTETIYNYLLQKKLIIS